MVFLTQEKMLDQDTVWLSLRYFLPFKLHLHVFPYIAVISYEIDCYCFLSEDAECIWGDLTEIHTRLRQRKTQPPDSQKSECLFYVEPSFVHILLSWSSICHIHDHRSCCALMVLTEIHQKCSIWEFLRGARSVSVHASAYGKRGLCYITYTTNS